MYLPAFYKYTYPAFLLQKCIFNFLGAFIQIRSLYPEIFCPAERCQFTTQKPNSMLKLVKIQLIKNSICQEKTSSIRIQQYDKS